MILYLYSNKNAVFNYLSRNLIACDSVVREIKGYRTISTKYDHFLFVTHKKLSRHLRESGISSPQEVYPITLEIEYEPENSNEEQQIILVQKIDEKYQCDLGSWRLYDTNIHIGAFIIGEIPFSCVSHYLFDSKDEMDGFERPSPDYWYPSRFILLSEDFIEELTLDLSENEIIENTSLDINCIETETRKREKTRAAMLNLANATQTWQYGKYRLNMDSFFQKILDVSDDIIQKIFPNYKAIKDIDNQERLDLLPWYLSIAEAASFNQKLYILIYDLFTNTPFGEFHTSEFFADCFAKIKVLANNETNFEKEQVYEYLDEISRLICGNSKMMIDDLLSKIPVEVDSLKALLFVAKNPDNYDQFFTSLDKYCLDDVVSKRRASMLWGALNGLKGMPGEGHNKENELLWQFIEAKVSNTMTTVPTPSFAVKIPEIVSNDGIILGIPPRSEEVITFEEVYNQIQQSESILTSRDFNKIAEALKNKLGKAEFNRKYTQVVASRSLKIEKGDVLLADIKNILGELQKCYSSPELKKTELYKEWVQPGLKFKIVYNNDQDYWKTLYLKLRGKKHE